MSLTDDDRDKTKAVMLPKLAKNAHARLSKYLPSDFNLTSLDVLAMMNLCPYEYAALGGSSFCSLFTEQEWRAYEYFIDVGFYGDYGFGSPSGRAQGIGYVEELAARLEKRLIYTSHSSINYTYDDNLAQFPLHQPLYMDMSHDDIIISVLTALSLDYFKYGPNGLPAKENAPGRTFRLSEMTPFGAQLFSEIWTCPSDTSFDELDPVLYTNPDLSSMKDTKDYIRFVLNNAPVPLDGNPGCNSGTNGFCAVDDFLSGIPKLKDEAMYQYACFENYSTNGHIGNGHPE